MLPTLFKPIVHIGLGKTASTSLQNYVFPNIPNLRSGVVFNDKSLIQLLNLLTMTTEQEKIFYTAVHSKKHFLSLESLVDWNPRNWEVAADRNLRLFGSDATIIITVRETHDYLKSVYQQIVHEGNVWSPSSFFVNGSDYDRLKPFLAPSRLTKFDVDSFDLEHLYHIYTERFSRVVLVPLATLKKLSFLEDIFQFNASELGLLKSELLKGRPINRAYSKRAMALTMKREKFLNYFHLMSYGSSFKEVLIRHSLDMEGDSAYLAFKDSDSRNKEVGLPQRLLKRIFTEFRWRTFLQCRFDRIVPYEKYELPNDVYTNRDLAARNDEFIKSFESD